MKQPIHPYVTYDSKEAAELLGLEPVTVQRYIRSGKLRATQFGKIYRISGQAILDLMSLNSDSVRMSQDRVRQIENSYYIKSRTFLLNHTQGEQLLRLIDKTNDALIATWNPDYNNANEDDLTIKYIGSRLFNSGMSAFQNCLSGYYQISFSLQRDFIEIQFLLDLFKSYPNRIKEWREAGDDTLKKKFSPVSIRTILDNRDGFKEKRRAAIYQQYCKYATHITYSGFGLLTNDSNQIELGPFYNERKLLNCIHDFALYYGYAMMSFISVIKAPDFRAQKLAIEHLKLFHEAFKEKLPIDPKIIRKLNAVHKVYSQAVEQI